MKKNILSICIHKPIHDVFMFTITPPNSTQWIPDVVQEKTNEWPVKAGTAYTLRYTQREISEVTVVAIKEHEYVEWISKDKTYHCRYVFTPLKNNSTKLEYLEWVDDGDIKDPFTMQSLEKLKSILES